MRNRECILSAGPLAGHRQRRGVTVGRHRFLSQELLGFDAGDSNLYRYVRNGPTNATDPSGKIKWETLTRLPDNEQKAVRTFLEKKFGVQYPADVAFYKATTDKGNTILLYTFDKDAEKYHCHGLTFGGIKKKAQGENAERSFTPLPHAVIKILEDEYQQKPIEPKAAMPGDTLIFVDRNGKVLHSAILVKPVLKGNTLDAEKTIIDTKNADARRRNDATLQSIRDIDADVDDVRIYRR